MEDHEAQSAKTSLVKELTKPRGMKSWCIQCVSNSNYGHYTASQDFKRKLVMYSIVLNLNGIFRRIGKTNERKIDLKNHRFKSSSALKASALTFLHSI